MSEDPLNSTRVFQAVIRNRGLKTAGQAKTHPGFQGLQGYELPPQFLIKYALDLHAVFTEPASAAARAAAGGMKNHPQLSGPAAAVAAVAKARGGSGGQGAKEQQKLLQLEQQAQQQLGHFFTFQLCCLKFVTVVVQHTTAASVLYGALSLLLHIAAEVTAIGQAIQVTVGARQGSKSSSSGSGSSSSSSSDIMTFMSPWLVLAARVIGCAGTVLGTHVKQMVSDLIGGQEATRHILGRA